MEASVLHTEGRTMQCTALRTVSCWSLLPTLSHKLSVMWLLSSLFTGHAWLSTQGSFLVPCSGLTPSSVHGAHSWFHALCLLLVLCLGSLLALCSGLTPGSMLWAQSWLCTQGSLLILCSGLTISSVITAHFWFCALVSLWLCAQGSILVLCSGFALCFELRVNSWLFAQGPLLLVLREQGCHWTSN